MQFVLDRVLSVAGTDAVSNELSILMDQIVDPSLSFTSETEDIVDATNNVVMVLENGRGATFSGSNAFFNTELLAAQVGSKVESGAEIAFTKYDILTLGEGGVADLSVATEATSAKVYKLAKDNSLTSATAIDDAATIADGKVTVTGAAKDDRVLVVYDAKVTDGDRIVALADAKNKLMNITAEVLLRELCNEELYYAYIIMKGKFSGEAEWAMTRDGNHAFEIRCFPEYCGSKELVEVIIVKG